MEKNLQLKIEALQKKARENGKVIKPSSRRRSSLHEIIKTKEQAERFMKILQSA